MVMRSWLLWGCRLALVAAAPWWFSLTPLPRGLVGEACAVLALAATAYGLWCWGLSVATAACLLLTQGRRTTGRAARLARAGLRSLGLSAAFGLLAAPLASANTPLPAVASLAVEGPAASHQDPSPAWPAPAATDPAPEATPTPPPVGPSPAPTGVPAPDVSAPGLDEPSEGVPSTTATQRPERAVKTPAAAPSSPASPSSPVREPTPVPSPSSSLPRGGSAQGYLPAPEAKPLGRAWGGGPAADRAVIVRAGDSLWSLAAEHLGPAATAGDVASEWPRWYRLNAEVIGSDPDLLRIGTRLFIPD